MPNEVELSGFYPISYYSFQDFTRDEFFLKTLLRKIALVRLGTRDPSFPIPGSLLDIGCGSGEFMHRMRKIGWEVFGVEPSAAAVAAGKKFGNLEIFNGSLFEAGFPEARFDYVRSNHSFEHLHDPEGTLREIARILKPRGRLFIGVPNTKGLVARLAGEYWWYLGAPVHTYNYSDENLRMLLERNGFSVEVTQFNSDFSGILGSVQIWMNRKNSRSSTEGFVFSSFFLRALAQRVAKFLDFVKVGDAIELIACKKSDVSEERFR